MDWYPISDDVAVASLLADSQATVLDAEIENRNTGVAYGSGAIVGVRIWMSVKPEALIEAAPHFHVMIVPAGLTIPTLNTDAQLKQNELFHWFMGMLDAPSGDPTTASVWALRPSPLRIRTARRFNQADRFVVVMHNTDESVAFGAGARASVLVDAYVRED